MIDSALREDSVPIANYSILSGRPTAGKVVSGASAHYDISVDTESGSLSVAVNIESVDGSEVLYVIKPGFTPPDPAGLQALMDGITPIPSQPGGLALDFIRSTVNGTPLVTRADMTLLPVASSSERFLAEALEKDRKERQGGTHTLQNAVVELLNQAVMDAGSKLYAFGSAFSDGGKQDGVHDIHMNQGNPLSNHGADNGTWQDGAIFLSLPGQASWTAVFLAFQTESWNTDGAGDPVQTEAARPIPPR